MSSIVTLGLDGKVQFYVRMLEKQRMVSHFFVRLTRRVRKLQPSRVEAWKEGRDFVLHPEDPWNVRCCLQDGVARFLKEEISMSEFQKVKRELRRKWQIPIWFKERFNLDFDDQIS